MQTLRYDFWRLNWMMSLCNSTFSAFWVTKATLTLTFKIKMWASTETSLIISFHLTVTTSKTSTQIYNKCKHWDMISLIILKIWNIKAIIYDSWRPHNLRIQIFGNKCKNMWHLGWWQMACCKRTTHSFSTLICTIWWKERLNGLGTQGHLSQSLGPCINV